MKVALCLLVLLGVVAPDAGAAQNTMPPSSSDSAASSSSGSSGESSWTTTSWTSHAGSSGTGSYGDVGYSGGSNWGSVGGSGSGWDWAGDAGWDPTKELWHFQPSWNWDSPYPPEGTKYIENWGNPPTREIPSRRSFNFGAGKGVSLVGATPEGVRADCGWRDWCVHLTFHSSYGVLSDFDAFVLDRYDSAERVYGDGFWYAREGNEEPPRVFAPLVLGGFSPEERAMFGNISSWRVKDMARRFNETRTTTWTLYPESDEMDVILSFKQLFTLLPGYPDGNTTDSAMNSDVISEWGTGDQVLLRVIAKREGSGATSVMMPRVLNFTGSQLFQVEYYSSLEYPQDDGNLTAAANAMTLDVVFNRRRYGSGLPWNPARPTDACDACNQQVMNHPVVARCLHGNVPERVFQDIYEQSANEQMEWDEGEWQVGDMGAPSNLSYYLNDVVDACFGLRWLLNGNAGDGSWSSDSAGFPNTGDRRSSSGSGFGDAGYGWSDTGSGSDRDYRNNDGSRWSSEFREPVYRYDDSGSRWTSWGYRDVGSASNFGDAGSRWSTSGPPGGPNAGDWPSVRDLRAALAIARETDTGIQCFVESRCPVGNRNFAESAGRMVIMEHDHAFVRVNFTDPNYKFYMWMALEELGPEGQFTTPELTSDHSPEEIAALVAGAGPNASAYNIAVDVRAFNNSELINWAKTFNEWITNYYNSGGSTSKVSAAWSSYSASSDDGSSFQFPPVGETSTSGFYSDVGPNSASADGSSPDAGQGSDGSAGHWWFQDPYPVPEPQFTVEISFRNVSVVPNILDVFVVGDEPMDSAPANMSWDARGSELRFQLSSLNLSTFEYVPPPPYVNLTWNEEIPEYPDLSSNGSIWNDSDIWSICTECADTFYECDNSTSCRIAAHAFLQEALSPSRFKLYKLSDETDNYGRELWGADLGARLRQSASFFAPDGYNRFMNFMACLSSFACNLDLSRQAYNTAKGEYVSVEPTLLEIVPAKSVFVVPTTATGEPENILMKYRGKEFLFEWKGVYNGNSSYDLNAFIVNVMGKYDADENLWAWYPLDTARVKVWDVTSLGQYAGVSGLVFNVTFKNNYFLEAEQPRFKPVSSDTYNELNSSNWKAIVSAYRNQEVENYWDGNSLVTWRKLVNWLHDLGWDPNFGDGNAQDVPICHQCMDSWTECASNQTCADTMRYIVKGPLWDALQSSSTRSSVDLSAIFDWWRINGDSQAYGKMLAFLSCLSAETCPVGYALPSDPAAPLVPITTKLVSHVAVTLPLGKDIVAIFKDYQFDFAPQTSLANDIANWLRSTTNYESKVEVQASINGSSVHYDITYYPAVTDIPTFHLRNDSTPFDVEGQTTFASFQLSSNLVEYGQRVSWNLIYYWLGLSAMSWPMFSHSGDIFSGTQVCHGCPECLEALARCQNDVDCLVSTREMLVPLLRNATLPLSTSTQDDGLTQVRLDLSSALLSMKNEGFQSREGWLAFAQLLNAMSTCRCEVGFGQWNSRMTYLEPTRLHIDSHVELSVRLYANTLMDVWFNGNVYSYSTDGSNPPMQAASNFVNWFASLVSSDPLYLMVDHTDPIVDDMSQSAIFTVHLYEANDKASTSTLLVNPSWIPTFIVTSADVSAEPPAEIIVTPWKISLQSNDRYPPFDRLLDLLEYGAVSDGMPASSDNGSFAGGSSFGDGCIKCAELRQSCFNNEECKSAISDRLLSNLQGMGFNGNTEGYWFDMSSQILDGVFQGIQSVEAKQKLLSLLTCSATKWDTTTAGASCIQLLTGKDYPSSTASLEITPATSIFPINKGKGINVYTLTGDVRYYNDNGNVAELADFMENEVLGGYDTSGVRVKAYETSGGFKVIYFGLTALSTPYIETQTDSSTMQFIFRSSTSDMLSIFSPWMQWLDPSKA